MRANPLLLAVAASAIIGTALAATPPADSGDRRQVCRAAAKQLGSRIRTPRRCRTEAQWREEDEAKGRLPLGAQVTQGQNDGQAVQQPR